MTDVQMKGKCNRLAVHSEEVNWGWFGLSIVGALFSE